MTAPNATARGHLFVISAPSGAGKTSLVRALIERDSALSVSVSHTTRVRRESERDGVEYNFVDRATFEQLVDEGRFLEHAEVFGNLYGTSADWVEAALAGGQDLILEIDWQGARQIRERYADVHDIFILPPDFETLKARLTGRGQDAPDVIARRLAEACTDVSHHADFRYLVVNDVFEVACDDLLAIVRAARLECAGQRQRHHDALAGFGG